MGSTSGMCGRSEPESSHPRSGPSLGQWPYAPQAFCAEQRPSAPSVAQPHPQSQDGRPVVLFATHVPPAAQSKSELHLPPASMTPHTGSAQAHAPKVQTPKAPQSVTGTSHASPSQQPLSAHEQKPPAHEPWPLQVFTTEQRPSAPTLKQGSQLPQTPVPASQAPPWPHCTGVAQFAPVKHGGHVQVPSAAQAPPFKHPG